MTQFNFEIVLNLTQHQATADQVEAGVCGLGSDEAQLKKLLTFTTLPTKEEVASRATSIARLASEVAYSTGETCGAMIGGAPYLMGPLAEALKDHGITPLFSFTERKAVDKVLPSGEVEKTSVFLHVGFVEA